MNKIKIFMFKLRHLFNLEEDLLDSYIELLDYESTLERR